jgi:hypothetical protein
MAYNSLIGVQLNKAFNAAKDLAIEAVFTKTTSSEFDFSTGEVNDTTIPSITTKIIITKTSKTPEAKTMTIMFKTKEVGSFSMTDHVYIGNDRWHFGNVITSNNHISVVELYHEI